MIIMLGGVIPMSNVAICPGNCSGNGECFSGTCLCQVEFAGGTCTERNLGYFLSFGILFYFICLLGIIQLVLCIRSDFINRKRATLVSSVFHFTIQKLLYLVTICAAGSRAVYFTLELHDFIPTAFKEYLFSTFYAFVMTGFSLIICFWAELFHLAGLKLDKPRFLTKSIGGFVVFNSLVYCMLIGQVITNHVIPQPLKAQLNEIVNAGFALLMFFSLVFFLIYGVEIFCKVQGAFKPENTLTTESRINLQQLFQSRLGLIAQASLQMAVTLFLMCDVFGRLWKETTSVGARNLINISFHLAELGCALWFPCCLWNVHKPAELWILNPRKLLMEDQPLTSEEPESSYNTFSAEKGKCKIEEHCLVEESTEQQQCWICYDDENSEQMIQPCDCKGGMKLVHHDCLKKWLLERPENSDNSVLSCSVCKVEYNVTSDHSLFWSPNKLQFRAWAQAVGVVVVMASMPVLLFFGWKKIDKAVLKVGCVVLLFMLEYFFLRLLGFNYIKAYKITRARALKIIGRSTTVADSSHLTVSVRS